jgi:uncharacterized protein
MSRTLFCRAHAALAAAPVAWWLLALVLVPQPVTAQPPTGGRPTTAVLPATVPLFPLPDAVLFPNGSRPLVIYEPRYLAMVSDALEGDRIIGMVMLQPGHETEYEGRPPIYAIGCAGRISAVERLPDGRYRLVLSGLTRFRVLSEDQTRRYRVGRVEAVPEAARSDDGTNLRADRKRLETILSTQGIEVSVRTSNDEEVVDMLAQYVEMLPARRQELLELGNAARRARALIDLLVAR